MTESYKVHGHIILLLAFVLSLTSCDGIDPMNCVMQPFYAEVEGKVDGVEVSAKIYCDPTEHVTKEIYNKLTVTFIAPESLSGITVSLRSDGKATVRLNNTEEELPLYSKLIEPYLALCPDEKYSSITKTDSGTVVVCNDGDNEISYFFDTNGLLKCVEGEFRDHKMLLKVIKIY